MVKDQVRAQSGAERRQHERVPARIEIRFNEHEQAARAFRAFSLNFSVGGVCVKTDRGYNLGESLQMSINIEELEYELRGRVAWVRGGAIGVRFEIANDRDREAIARIMRHIEHAA